MSASKRTRKTARKSAARKPAKNARKSAKKASGTTAARAPRKAASKKAAKKDSRKKTGARPKAATAARKTIAREKTGAGRTAAKKTPVKTARKPAGTTGSSSARAPVVKRKSAPPAPPRPRARRKGPVSSDVARQHFQELLEAKIERVRQGPSYPPANEFTGQRPSDSGAAGDARSPGDADKPAPEATYGDPAFTHGRGNQGMRPQK